MIRFINKKKKI